MLFSGPEYGSPRAGDRQSGDKGADAGGGGRLALVLPHVSCLDSRYHKTPFTGVLTV